MRVATIAALVLIALTCSAVFAEGLPQGPWTVRDGVYSIATPDRTVYYLTDAPYVSGEGAVEALVTPKRTMRSGGWGVVGLLLTLGPSDFWTFGLVEGPEGQHYTEVIENYQGVHQAQTMGPTRLNFIEGGYGFDWQYGHTYRLRFGLAGDRIVGDVFEGDNARPAAHLGWQLGSAPALREGWGGLRCEMMEADFAAIKVTAAPPGPAAALKSYPQGQSGCVGLYFGDDLPGGERPPVLDGLSRGLAAAGFETARLTSLDLAQPGTLSFPALRYLVADVRRLPNGATPRILAWMRQGGILVSVTAPAFGETFYRVGDRWLSWEDYSQHGLAEVAGKGREVSTWSAQALADWHEGRDPQGEPAPLEVQPAATPSGDAALAITAPGLIKGWWSLGRTFASPPLQEGETLTCFWAKGDEHTPEMSVEWAEDDGARWIAVVSLEPRWRYYALPPQAFAYWIDNPSKGRGGGGDSLRPGHGVMLAFGMSGSHTPSVLVPDVAAHRMWIGPIRTAKVPPENLSALAPNSRPELEALSPGFKLHEVKGAKTWRAAEAGKAWGLPAELPVVASLSAIRRPMGAGFDRGYWWRWVPLLEARDANGRYCGAPMSLLVSEMMPMPRAAWVSLGLQRLGDFGPRLQQAVAAVMTRLASKPVLFEGGAQHFLWRPGEKVAVGAKVVNPGGPRADVEVRFTVSGKPGKAAPPVVAKAAVGPREVATVRATLPDLRPGQYLLAVELAVGGEVVDRIAHPLTIEAAPTGPPPPSEVVAQRDGGLYLGGKPWHPVGCNYWPHNLGGLPTSAYWRGWLDGLLYDPELAEEDLAQLESWGFRAIAGIGGDVNWTGGGERTLRNALDFLARCRRHHIKVFLFVAGLDPRARNDEVATQVIRAVRNNPAIVGYDIAWEPGYWAERHKYVPQWRQWLELQFGSLDAAEQALGYKLPRDADGQVDIPPDAWFRDDGPWRRVSAAYHAYWNWQLGAEYRRSAALVRSIDPLHLVGFRGSNITSPLEFKPVHQPAVLHFMDWAGPEGYDVPVYGGLTAWPEVSAKGLVTRMLSFISGGKPVVWFEFGMPIYPNGTNWHDDMIFIKPDRYAYQVEEGRRWWQMEASSGAWGSLVWWYPGGFRCGENSDCGLVDPDNRPRPIAETERGFVPKFNASETFKPDTMLEFKPEEVGGWVGEYLRLRPQYAALVEQGHRVGVRTVAAPMTSADCPLVDPSGAAWPGKGPLRYLNAIFERIRVKVGERPWIEVPLPIAPAPVEVKIQGDGPVQIEAWAGSLAEARWLPGAVSLQVSGDAKGEGALDKAVEFQGSGHFGPVRVAGEPGKMRLQLSAAGRAALGEIVQLNLTPGR
jgi:hypothetical protein